MKSFYAFYGMLTLVLLISCGDTIDPLPEEEEQSESPVASTLIFPENNTECQEGTIINDTESRVPFRWNASEHTDSYEVHLENLENGSKSNHNSDANELEIVIERGTAYSWYVVSKSNVSEDTAESERWQFYNTGPGIVNYAPFPADLIRPTNNETLSIATGSILLEWEASDIDNDIVSYEVFMEVENPPTTSIAVSSEAQISVAVTSQTTYYWFVEVTDSAHNSTQSEVFTFSIE